MREVLGDCTIAVFPSSSKDSAVHAVDAASQIRMQVGDMGHDVGNLGSHSMVDVITGVASGRVFVGRLGTADSGIPATTGPVMQLAKHLMDQCCRLHVPILMCPETAKRIAIRYASRSVSIPTSEGDKQLEAFEPDFS